MKKIRQPTDSAYQGRHRGHDDGSVQGRHSHVTAAMRGQLLDDLTRVWHRAVDARRGLAERSPVPVLDRLLVARAKEVGV